MAFYPKYKKRVYKKRATAKPKATKVAKAVVQNAIVKYTNKHIHPLKHYVDPGFNVGSGFTTLNNTAIPYGYVASVFGRIPRYDASITTQRGMFAASRISDSILLEKIQFKMVLTNKSASYNQFVRLVILRNSNNNEVMNTTGANALMTYVGNPLSISTDWEDGRMQLLNTALVKSKSDIIHDKVYDLPAPGIGSYPINNYTRTINIVKKLNTLIKYEQKPDLPSSLDILGGNYNILWWIINEVSAATSCPVDCQWEATSYFRDQ